MVGSVGWTQGDGLVGREGRVMGAVGLVGERGVVGLVRWRRMVGLVGQRGMVLWGQKGMVGLVGQKGMVGRGDREE